VVRAGVPPEGSKYTPHVTLSYPKDPSIPKLQQYLASHNLFRSERFEVTHFTLFSSFTGGEQAIYSAERSYSLSKPQVAAAGKPAAK
jgi:2'-5' RNA ligase